MHKKLGEEFDRTYRSIDLIDTVTQLGNRITWLGVENKSRGRRLYSC